MSTMYRIRHKSTGAWLEKKTGVFTKVEKHANNYFSLNEVTRLRDRLVEVWIVPKWYKLKPGDLEIVEYDLTEVRTF